MKILYVTSNGGIHDYRFLMKLAPDYEVLLLHYAAKDLIPEIQSIPGLKIISKVPFKKSFPALSERRGFKEIVRDFGPDIIHSGYVWQAGILASNIDFHPHLSMVWGSDILTEPDKNFIIKKIVNKVMRQADHIQCDADFVKQKIISDYKTEPAKITVFPWGIDLKTFSKVEKTESRQLLNLGEDKFIVIYNRHLEPVYNPLGMLEGFKKFAEGKNDALLLMLSDGSLKEDALKYISANNLGDKIKIIGSKPNAQMPFYLNASDVYLSTSISDGTSLSLLEAMGCGLALVVTDVPAIQEWVGPGNGLMIPINDPSSVASAMEKYYNDRGLIIRHGEKNIEIASLRADWDKNYEMLRKIYSDLITVEKKKS